MSQATTFNAVMSAIWGSGVPAHIVHPERGPITTESPWEVAAMFGGARLDVPGTGVGVIQFPDLSCALCGAGSVITTWGFLDHVERNPENLCTYIRANLNDHEVWEELKSLIGTDQALQLLAA